MHMKSRREVVCISADRTSTTRGTSPKSIYSEKFDSDRGERLPMSISL